MRKTQITVSRDALAHNLGVARKLSGHGKIFAVIKSNAYGHGLTEAARALAAADGYAVALTEEAVTLRQELETDLKTGIETDLETGKETGKDILVLQGPADREEAEAARQFNLTCVIHRVGQADYAAEFANDPAGPLRVWLKINTGMNRMGADPAEVPSVLNKPGIRVLAMMTHFAAANRRDKHSAHRQLARFDAAVAGLQLPKSPAKSLANSAALLALPESRADFNRPGLMLYGASPLDDVSAASLKLKPAMTLAGELISVRRVRRGDKVGYDEAWTAPGDRYVGLVSLGYGDGYPRTQGATAARVPVLVNGRMCYLAGRVSMDLVSIDLGPAEAGAPARVGDRVIFWGEGLPAEKVAAAVGRSPYDLFAGLTGRLRRNYSG